MDKLTWELLYEAAGRLEADAIKSLLEAEGIPVELIQEAVGHLLFPVTVDGLGLVQIFVPKKHIDDARFWLKAYHEGLPEDSQV